MAVHTSNSNFALHSRMQPLSSATKEKLANFTHVPAENCLGVHDVSNIYRVPLLLQHQGAAQNLLARLALISRPNAKLLSEWTSLAELVRGSADSHHLVASQSFIALQAPAQIAYGVSFVADAASPG